MPGPEPIETDWTASAIVAVIGVLLMGWPWVCQVERQTVRFVKRRALALTVKCDTPWPLRLWRKR